MAMTPENYRRIEEKCISLCGESEKIITEYNNGNTMVEIEAKDIYDKLIGMKTELQIAIRNIKTPSIIEKYNKYLQKIEKYQSDIYMIAFII